MSHESLATWQMSLSMTYPKSWGSQTCRTWRVASRGEALAKPRYPFPQLIICIDCSPRWTPPYFVRLVLPPHRCSDPYMSHTRSGNRHQEAINFHPRSLFQGYLPFKPATLHFQMDKKCPVFIWLAGALHRKSYSAPSRHEADIKDEIKEKILVSLKHVGCHISVIAFIFWDINRNIWHWSIKFYWYLWNKSMWSGCIIDKIYS